MESVKVDEAWLNSGARPVVDVFPDELRSDDGKVVIGQKEDNEGRLRWRVEFPFKGPEDRRAVMAMVTVSSATEPDVIDRVPVFAGVVARKWQMNRQDGSATSGLSFAAESFSTADQKPSVKRAAAATAGKSEPPTPST